MNIEQQSLALRLAYEHVRIMAAQAKSPAADELTQEALVEATDMFHKIALMQSLNYDERQIFIALIDSYLEDETVSLDEHELAIVVLKLI